MQSMGQKLILNYSTLKESINLTIGQVGKKGETARMGLSKALSTFPPAPPLEGCKDVKDRPTYPDWANIVDPND